MKGREVFLLILIILAGVFFYHAYTGKLDIQWNWDWDDEEGFLNWGDEYVFEESETLTSPLPASLHLKNSYGDIEIVGSDTESISITLKKRIKRNSERKAREVAEDLKMRILREGERIDISVNRDDFTKKNFRTDFILSLPSSMIVNCANSYGKVDIRSVKSAEITNRIGTVQVENIDGDLILKVSYRNAEVVDIRGECRIESANADLDVRDILGRVDIVNRYGRIELSDIPQDIIVDGSHTRIRGMNLTGNISIESSYKSIYLENTGPVKITATNAPIEIYRVNGLLDIKNNYGSLDLSDIEGDLMIEGKNLKVTGRDIVSNLLTVSTSYKTVDLSRFSGKSSIHADNARIILFPSPLTHGIEASGDYTDIDFHWPEGRYPIEAQSSGGKVLWNLPFEPAQKKTNGLSLVKAFSDEPTPAISLSTRYGKITIQD